MIIDLSLWACQITGLEGEMYARKRRECIREWTRAVSKLERKRIVRGLQREVCFAPERIAAGTQKREALFFLRS